MSYQLPQSQFVVTETIDENYEGYRIEYGDPAAQLDYNYIIRPYRVTNLETGFTATFRSLDMAQGVVHNLNNPAYYQPVRVCGKGGSL